MPQSTRDIKRRIGSIKNTRQITKAMEMVSAAKMRRSQEVALAARPYALKALEVLSELSAKTEVASHPLLGEKESDKTALVLISTDKGLCGGLNTNLFKKVIKYLQENTVSKEVDFIAVGKKAKSWIVRSGFNLSMDFSGFGDKIDVLDVLPLARILMKDFREEKYGRVAVAYTNFESTLKQEAVIRPLLPITREILEKVVEEIVPERGKFSEEEQEVKKEAREYLFEPSVKEVLDMLLPKLIETQVYHMALEANASEHSARMVAMKNASEAAGEMIDELNLYYNKARQASITQEIAEISAGKAALEK